MSSNMIKAYSIAYDTQKIKSLDIDARENDLEERVRKLVSSKPALSEGKEVQDFVPGLLVEDLGELEISEETPEAKPALTEQDIEEIKNSLREEIMAEMMPIINRKGEDIVANARAQANGIIEAGKRDAEAAKEGILKMASAQGYEEGLKHAKEEEKRTLSALEARRLELENEYQTKIAELEPAFANILVELVKKVTNVAYDNHKEILVYLIETGLGFAQKDTYLVKFPTFYIPHNFLEKLPYHLLLLPLVRSL